MKEEMINERYENSLFKKNINLHLKRKDAKNFILVERNKKKGTIYF